MINDKYSHIYDKFDYSKLSNDDVISAIIDELRSGVLFLRDDGKIDSENRIHFDPPWTYVKNSLVRECSLWHSVMFRRYGLLPSPCLKCWKIVVRPKTLEQLFMLYEIQRTLDVPSKCGIETRPTVFGLYGGYFYTDSIEEGMERWAQVREIITNDMGPDVAVFLKRGCTEFEHRFGPSDKWEEKLLPDQTEQELKIENTWARRMWAFHQTEHLTARVQQKWIHWAYEGGDETYIKFNKNKTLFPPYVTYHQRVDNKPKGEEDNA